MLLKRSRYLHQFHQRYLDYRFANTMSSHAEILSSSDEDIARAVKFLQTGKLVAIPTETVYGLGANAYDEKAVKAIFAAKGRPLTDPLIVHVTGTEAALKLVDICEGEEKMFKLLAGKFWPGPLTIITKAVGVLPDCITACTGFVGLRVPNHPIARKILCASKLPIAAPSANRFGHVSPTKASHVFDDLGKNRGVSAIVSGDDGSIVETCEHGIESTVLKIDYANRCLKVFRKGAVSLEQLESLVTQNREILFEEWTVESVNRAVSMLDNSNAGVATKGEQAPGQAITHYAPDNAVCIIPEVVDVSRLSLEVDTCTPISADMRSDLLSWEMSTSDLKSAVVLDFGGQWRNLLEKCFRCNVDSSNTSILAYRDFSRSGSCKEAARSLFDVLRWAESVPGVKYVILAPILKHLRIQLNSTTSCGVDGTMAADVDGIREGVQDRLFRSASGRVVSLKLYKA